jgi:SOS-response transcriptional repressor LexA
MKKVLGMKQLPIVSNKVEGHPKDKVFYLKIEDDDMLGFRISKGDLAFAYVSHDIQNNAICLIEYNEEKVIRQIKNLGHNQILLISNKDKLRTETVSAKELRIVARLARIEFQL